MKISKNTNLNIVHVLLKFIAFAVLILGIIFSILFVPANLFSMGVFVGIVVVVAIIFYTLSVIVKMLDDLSESIQTMNAEKEAKEKEIGSL